jgi:NAD-dependent dihydropyrimidine dehydrogenase PreA subunit
MSDKAIALVYFSGTHVTKTCAQVIGDALTDLGCVVELFDVTPYASRQEALPVDDFDAFIFGFPVFGDFAPSVINTWLPTLQGNGMRCAQFFTYGARTSGYAHFHTMQLLEGAGFRVLLSAEFLGRHSFNVGGWQILPDRPDESDFNVAKGYAALALERFSAQEPPVFRLQKPFGYYQAIAARQEQPERTQRGWTNPVRVTDICSMCRDCETECPTQAFNADTGLSDPADCIECMHCLYICPDEVIEIDKRMKGAYNDFLASWHLTEQMMRAKKSKIISDSWQAAS